ncbi:hypothetical protein FHG08_18430 [Pseudoalteromonas sp. Scap03]|mgnify:CR=1 FL=1|uniref:hypothetical protein n=1 Tax=unclassified Pseudoalteromonas TaxID=194690 RepID=UPI00095FDE57|nr:MULTISPECIES: hypothetical protein [unclassified Pseudoalteromonas]NWL17630.1 hypothetical protein [Pseudoalteromonas sp. Scap03]OLF74683.1 hypothetical protein AWH60_08570 [Pseudoalteromonas haloplanktis]QLE83051.1 hypothetical protein FLM54_16055 [Pseudoalteromonas sp. Scap25]QLE90993.1 hypothetical protein FLM47_16065 [Pseudoalteromonas sp. Scap06]
MKKLIYTFFVLILCFDSFAGTLFPKHDINDPKLSKNTVILQCQKSLMYAPRQLEKWCEKAYEMGYWQALEVIGLHTSDGSRYITEAQLHAENGDPDGILALAFAYESGRFVTKNLHKSIALYNQYLNENQGIEEEKMRVIRTHEALYLIYTKLGDFENAAKQKRFLDESNYKENKEAILKKQMREAGISIDSEQ